MEENNSKERYICIQIIRQNHARSSSLKECAAMEIVASTSTLQRNFLRKDIRIFSKKFILVNCSLMCLPDSIISSSSSIYLIGRQNLLIISLIYNIGYLFVLRLNCLADFSRRFYLTVLSHDNQKSYLNVSF